MKRARTLKLVVWGLDLVALVALGWAGWRVYRGPAQEDLPYDAARYALRGDERPAGRDLSSVWQALDRPLAEPPAPPAAEPGPPAAPSAPRPPIRLLAVLDDREQGRGRAAIVAFSGQQRLVLPDELVDPAGQWRVEAVHVEGGPERALLGVLTLRSGQRVERFEASLRRAGF